MDEALTRYKSSGGQGRSSGRSPAKRDQREVTFALTDEILQALDDDGVSTKAAEGSVASAEPDPHEPTTNVAGPSAVRDDDDDDDERREGRTQTGEEARSKGARQHARGGRGGCRGGGPRAQAETHRAPCSERRTRDARPGVRPGR